MKKERHWRLFLWTTFFALLSASFGKSLDEHWCITANRKGELMLLLSPIGSLELLLPGSTSSRLCDWSAFRQKLHSVTIQFYFIFHNIFIGSLPRGYMKSIRHIYYWSTRCARLRVFNKVSQIAKKQLSSCLCHQVVSTVIVGSMPCNL